MSAVRLHHLHRTVDPARWCIGYEDLEVFEAEVRKAIQDGRLTCQDPHIGPSIHEVNEGYIKPVTLRAGGMSWALMQNPEGMPCDAFVTHCWAEGVFEFTAAVKAIWPTGVRSIYCCFLANPQNGDIGELLGNDPMHSPFARALLTTRYVLVIPNHTVSIYTRLWCVFEAHLAIREEIPIVMPARPQVKSALKYLLPLFLVAAGSAYVASITILEHMQRPWTPCNLQRLLSLTLGMHSHKRQWTGLVYVTAASAAVGIQLLFFGYQAYLFQDGQGHTKEVFIHLLDYVIAAYISAAAIEIIWKIVKLEALDAEGQKLEMRSVSDAGCSNQADAVAIRQAISGSEEEIDKAIKVLKRVGRWNEDVNECLTRGISKRRLRYGVFHAYGMAGAAHWLANFARVAAAPMDAKAAFWTIQLTVYLACSCVLTLMLTIRQKDKAMIWTDKFFYSSLVAFFACEFLWFVAFKQTVSSIILGTHSVHESILYFTTGFAAVFLFMGLSRGFWCSLRRSKMLTDQDELSEPASEESEDEVAAGPGPVPKSHTFRWAV